MKLANTIKLRLIKLFRASLGKCEIEFTPVDHNSNPCIEIKVTTRIGWVKNRYSLLGLLQHDRTFEAFIVKDYIRMFEVVNEGRFQHISGDFKNVNFKARNA